VSCGLRDVLEFETLGRPAVLVASAAFTDAAERQATLLGQPGLRRAFVAHPVQDRTDDEMREMARAIADETLASLGAPTDGAARSPGSGP
jgi:hypothetical protein